MLGILRLQEPVHNVRIYKTKLPVPESLWQRASDSEPKFLVQLNSRSVGAHDIVELHGHEAITLGFGKAVLDKCTANAFALSGRMHDIGGASNVSAQVWVIGAVFVHAKYVRSYNSNVRGLCAKPMGLKCLTIEVVGERQSITRGNDGLKDAPHCIKVRGFCLSDFHDVWKDT